MAFSIGSMTKMTMLKGTESSKTWSTTRRERKNRSSKMPDVVRKSIGMSRNAVTVVDADEITQRV